MDPMPHLQLVCSLAPSRAPSGNMSGFELAGIVPGIPGIPGIPGLIDPAIVAIKDVRCAVTSEQS